MINPISSYTDTNNLNFLNSNYSFFSDDTLLLIIIPLLGFILTLILPAGNNGNVSKRIGLYTSLINLLIVVKILIKFNPNDGNFQFITNI